VGYGFRSGKLNGRDFSRGGLAAGINRANLRVFGSAAVRMRRPGGLAWRSAVKEARQPRLVTAVLSPPWIVCRRDSQVGGGAGPLREGSHTIFHSDAWVSRLSRHPRPIRILFAVVVVAVAADNLADKLR
jgi:hypothetical protein